MAELLAADIDETLFYMQGISAAVLHRMLRAFGTSQPRITHVVSESPMALFTTHSVAAGVTVHLQIMTLADQ